MSDLKGISLFLCLSQVQAPVAVEQDDPKSKTNDCYGVFCLTYDLKAVSSLIVCYTWACQYARIMYTYVRVFCSGEGMVCFACIWSLWYKCIDIVCWFACFLLVLLVVDVSKCWVTLLNCSAYYDYCLLTWLEGCRYLVFIDWLCSICAYNKRSLSNCLYRKRRQNPGRKWLILQCRVLLGWLLIIYFSK